MSGLLLLIPSMNIQDECMGKRGRKPLRGNIAWSAKLAYAVGLIATDGSLSVNGRHIDLTSKDREQLVNFMGCIDKQLTISTKTGSYKDEPVSRVQFSDVTLYNFLISIGLTPCKTKTLGKVAIPDKYFFDFLRGHYDGDGCFYSYFDPRWKSSFMFYLIFVSSSEDHILWLRDSVTRLAGISGNISRAGSTLQLRFAKNETRKLLSRMYNDSGAVSLSRKRLKIEQALGIVGQSLASLLTEKS